MISTIGVEEITRAVSMKSLAAAFAPASAISTANELVLITVPPFFLEIPASTIDVSPEKEFLTLHPVTDARAARIGNHASSYWCTERRRRHILGRVLRGVIPDVNGNSLILIDCGAGTGFAYRLVNPWGGNAPCFPPPLVRLRARPTPRPLFFPPSARFRLEKVRPGPHVTIIAR